MIVKAKLPFDPHIFLTKVGDGRTIADYRKNQKVFSQGDPADAIFYIQNGKVKLTVISKQGKEAVVGILGTADFFGEGCLAGQPLRMATATAISACVIVRLEKRSTLRVLHDEFPFVPAALAMGQSHAASLVNFSKLSNLEQIQTMYLFRLQHR